MLTIKASKRFAVPPPPPSAAAAPERRAVQCACGHAFAAPLANVSAAITCPRCGNETLLSLAAPRRAGSEATEQPSVPLPTLTVAKPDRGEQVALEMAYVAGGCVAMLVVAMVATSLVNSYTSASQQAPPAAPPAISRPAGK